MRPNLNAAQSTIKERDQREQELIARYGDLLKLPDIAKVFRYPSAQAVRLAHMRRALPFELVRIPNRRGWFATAKTVATALTHLDRSNTTDDIVDKHGGHRMT
jgi:hypothetical protein